MSDAVTRVKGFSELQKFLDELPVKLERNIMRGALRAGMKQVAADARANCPVGPPSATGARRYKLYQGALRDSIRITTASKGSKVIASVKVGGKLKNGADVWYAHLIEYTGAVAHLIKAQKGAALAIGGGLYKMVDHPGMQAHPFLRPALSRQANNALLAAGQYIQKRLATKEGLNAAADVEIGIVVGNGQ